MRATVRRVDEQGRVALPSKWRAKALKGSHEVLLIEEGESILVRPRKKRDLASYFDSVIVDVDPSAFSDYNKLKKALLLGERR
jgi:bifunctional DNA-binding transcriptional regulator/antitoxin component of YhaV-PrlF toxin-antitoxin module